MKKTLQSDSGSINAVAIAPNSQTVVSGSADHKVRIWNLTHDSPPKMLSGHSGGVGSVAISSDGKTVISGSYGAIKQWDLETGRLKSTFPRIGNSKITIGPLSIINTDAERFDLLDINPTTQTAITSDLKVIDLKTNQEKATQVHKIPTNLFATYFLSTRISPNGQFAVLQYENHSEKYETRLKVWNLMQGKMEAEVQANFSHQTFIEMPLALSHDRIFGSVGEQVKVWNLQTAQLEAVVDTGGMTALEVTPNGKVLVGLSHNADPNQVEIKVWRFP